MLKNLKLKFKRCLPKRFVHKRVYWVFRRFTRIEPNILEYKSIRDMPDPETWKTEQSFALHFVEPFKNKHEAQKAIDYAKQLQPWQEFIILLG
jgi:hypothetical protein